ncbi:MAG: alpha/beta fold hydrolase, partial [Lysobacteraceae bacterium]
MLRSNTYCATPCAKPDGCRTSRIPTRASTGSPARIRFRLRTTKPTDRFSSHLFSSRQSAPERTRMLHAIGMIEDRQGTARLSSPLRATLLSVSLATLSIVLVPLSSRTAQAQVPAATETAAFDPGAEAQTMVERMDAGDFAAVRARFDETMAAGLSIEQLQQLWGALPSQLGARKDIGTPRVIAHDNLRIAALPIRFENATIEAMFAFAADGRIAGFGLRPADSASPAEPVAADAPFRESEVAIGESATALPATLAMPEGDGPFPAVVLVHGSGAHDRDSTIGPKRPFLDIARGLAARGIAVLRYDKRAKARPQDHAGGVTVDSETTDDALHAVAKLRAQPHIDPRRIFVLGHSQGAMMAPRIGRRDPEIAGLILLAAPARPVLDLLIEQNRRIAVLNDGKTSDAENAAIEKLAAAIAAIRAGRDLPAADAPLGQSAAYWRSIDAVDPVAEARQIAQPMLFLQGGRDIQVVDADWQGWK